MNSTSSSVDDDAPIIVFLIGGPGSGKTTPQFHIPPIQKIEIFEREKPSTE